MSKQDAGSERGNPHPEERILYLLSALVLALFVVLAGIAHWWLRDLKFDDAWIHFRYARNLVTGQGFVYNAGERVLGSAGVVWNFILAGLCLAGTSARLSASVSMLNFLALAGTAGALAAALMRVVPGWYALLAAAVVISRGPLLVSSIGGMETTVLVLLHALVFLALVRGRFLLANLLAGTALCFRVEAFAMMAAALLAVWLYQRKDFWKALGSLLLLPAAAFGWSWAYFGSPIANSTLAKKLAYVLPRGESLRVALDRLSEVFAFELAFPLRGSYPEAAAWFGLLVWIVLATFGYLLLRRRSQPASLVVLQAVLPLLFYAVMNPLMFPWYFCTFVPPATLLATLGIFEVGRRLPRTGHRLQYGLTLAILLAFSIKPLRGAWLPFVPPDHPRFSVQLPNARESARTYRYAAVARWLNSRSGPADRVCTPEIGAFGFVYHGRILDPIGLVSPEAQRYHPLPPALRRGGMFGAIPPQLVHDYLPEFVVALDSLSEALVADPRFRRNYEEIGRWNWFGGPVRWHDLPPGIWGGSQVLAFRRRAAAAPEQGGRS